MSKAAGFFLSLMLVVAGGLLLYKLLNNGTMAFFNVFITQGSYL